MGGGSGSRERWHLCVRAAVRARGSVQEDMAAARSASLAEDPGEGPDGPLYLLLYLLLAEPRLTPCRPKRLSARIRRSMAERTRARPISASTSLMTLRPAISPCEARRVARGGSPSEFGTPRRAGACRRASTPARRKQPLSCGRRVGVRVSGCAGPAVPSHHTEQLAPMHSGWFVAAFVGSRKT